MRALGAIFAAALAVWAMPATSRADALPPGPAAPSVAATCDEPGPSLRPHRVRRPVRHHVRRRVVRHRYAVEAPPVYAVPIYYDPPIPSPWDTAYDRGMVLHFRSPPVSGEFTEPNLPLTPLVRSVQPYRIVGPGRVLQLDGITGEYIALAQYDAQRFVAVPRPMPAP
jgi:hypothetical protein